MENMHTQPFFFDAGQGWGGHLRIDIGDSRLTSTKSQTYHSCALAALAEAPSCGRNYSEKGATFSCEHSVAVQFDFIC